MTQDLIQQRSGRLKTFEGWGESCWNQTSMKTLYFADHESCYTLCCTDPHIYHIYLMSQITDHSSVIPTSSTELTPSHRLVQCPPPLGDLILVPLPQGPTHRHLRGTVFTPVPLYRFLPGRMGPHIPGGSDPHHQLNFNHLGPLTINL